MVSCQKGPTRHAYAWQIGPFWQDTLEFCYNVFSALWRVSSLCDVCHRCVTCVIAVWRVSSLCDVCHRCDVWPMHCRLLSTLQAIYCPQLIISFHVISFQWNNVFIITFIHWSWVMNICISKLTIIRSGNRLSPCRCNMMTSSNGNISCITGPLLGWIHWSPANSPHKGQWCGAFMFSLICAGTKGWANNQDASDLRCHRTHYDITVIEAIIWTNSGISFIRPFRTNDS